jgi:hypothetical protein
MAAAIDVADDALRINYKGGAACDAQKAEHAVSARDFLFRVTQQGECKSQLFRKGAVGFRLVHADAQHLGARLFEFSKTILVCLEFLRSARGVGVNVESQDNAAIATEIAQPNQPSRVVGQFKIRRRVSNVQCHPGFP